MENSFKSFIDKSKSVLILLPTKPFLDQVAASLSLFLALREGREVQVYCPSPMTVEFNRLIGVNKISQELGNKNLIIRFSDYKANDIERVSYDIDDGQFKLSVIPKPGITPPTKDQINLNYSGVSADMVILVGGTNDSHFPIVASKELAGVELVHLGTKDVSLAGKSVISFAKPLSSVSEIVGLLLKENGYQIDSDIATNLLMGIDAASGSFSSAETTADTFLLISELMRAGGKRQNKSAINSQDFPPGAIPQAIGKLPVNQPLPMQGQVQSAGDQNEAGNAPKDWYEPKIFKGTSTK